MSSVVADNLPDATGHFGPFGGRYVPETLMHPLQELEAEYFRANLYVRGWPAWSELDLLEHTLAIGDIRLKVVKRIVRCTATNVDPETAVRDLDIPNTLTRTLGHRNCGVYAEVVTGGTIRIDDKVETLRQSPA
jgi:uncharacterized protein YcbX